ncbi:MAG: hypothetical protein ING44_17920 [Telmatospirillum sp.]|nr:hypothetical protein [Telmatospirillum sp.]
MKTPKAESRRSTAIAYFIRKIAVVAGTGALLFGLGGTASAQSIQQVQTFSPGVAYRYVTAQDLEMSKQSAVAYCNLQQSIPRLLSSSVDLSGAKTVAFGCLRVSPIPSQIPDYNPNLGYNQLTDAEFAVAMQNADNYCKNNGGHRLITNFTQTSTGGSAAKFECSSP